jgi:regulator of protease activity HflC (stomatin/prohibitin superfamily)
MFQWLTDLIQMCGRSLRLFAIVEADEHAVKLRFGRYRSLLAAGYHFTWPLLETTRKCKTVQGTMRLFDQGLTTKDKQDITVSAIVTFRVEDPKKFLLDTDGGSAVDDVTYGAVSEWVAANDRDYILDPKNWRRLRTEINAAAKEYGIEIVRVRFGDLCRSKAIRLLGRGE